MDLNELLRQYGEASVQCFLTDSGSIWYQRRKDIESQITALFERGVQAERAEIAAFFRTHPYCRMVDRMQEVCDCEEIAKAIEARKAGLREESE